MKFEEYLQLPYTRIIKKIVDENGTYYFGKILELEGVMSDGKTIEELNSNLDEAMALYIEVKMGRNENIPIPEWSEYSGKFNLRIPKSLHESLAIKAKEEGISLNQYILYKLANC